MSLKKREKQSCGVSQEGGTFGPACSVKCAQVGWLSVSSVCVYAIYFVKENLS